MTPPGIAPAVVPAPVIPAVPNYALQQPIQAAVPPLINPAVIPQPMVNQAMMQPLMGQPIIPQMAPQMIPPQSVMPIIPSNLPLMAQMSGSQPNIPLVGSLTSPPTGGKPSLMDSSKPNTPDSVKTLSKAASIASNPSTEWQIPHSSKLKYTQLFNTHDRNKTGFLTGVQARGILVQTQLPQQLLAKIW